MTFAFSAVMPSCASRTRCAANCPPSHSSARSSATPSSARLIALSIARRDASLSPATLSSTRGTSNTFKRIIIDANDAAPPPVNPTSSHPPTSTTPAAVPIITDTQTTPIASRPKCMVRPPVRDDDPRYSVTSYGRTRPAEHANVALTDETSVPRTYKEAKVCYFTHVEELVFNQTFSPRRQTLPTRPWRTHAPHVGHAPRHLLHRRNSRSSRS